MSSMLYEVALPGRETFHEELARKEFSELSNKVKDEMFSSWQRHLHELADDRLSFESEMDCGCFLFSKDGGCIYDCSEDDDCW